MSLIVRTLSAGIGTWRDTRWLPGFAGPFPPPLWMSAGHIHLWR